MQSLTCYYSGAIYKYVVFKNKLQREYVIFNHVYLTSLEKKFRSDGIYNLVIANNQQELIFALTTTILSLGVVFLKWG